ncbi:MAG: DUF4365 domain-containing protein [Methylobacter sp.]|nr:DUF4365 domain-containing protein [Methylobacter sp.]
MEKNQKKELFSRAYVKAIAAQVGFRTAIPDVDDDSVDIILKGKGFSSPIRNPQLEVQLKCTAKDNDDPSILKFTLPIKNYNDLRGDDLVCPRYLFVLVVPEDCEDWLTHEQDFVTVKHCCYWMSIKDFPDKPNTTNISIIIPKSQLLTSKSMRTLMEMASVWGVA